MFRWDRALVGAGSGRSPDRRGSHGVVRPRGARSYRSRAGPPTHPRLEPPPARRLLSSDAARDAAPQHAQPVVGCQVLIHHHVSLTYPREPRAPETIRRAGNRHRPAARHYRISRKITPLMIQPAIDAAKRPGAQGARAAGRPGAPAAPHGPGAGARPALPKPHFAPKRRETRDVSMGRARARCTSLQDPGYRAQPLRIYRTALRGSLLREVPLPPYN